MKKNNEEKIFNYKNVTIMVVILLFMSFLNMCNSCNSNKTAKNTKKELDAFKTESLLKDSITDITLKNLPGNLQHNIDQNTANFLYWERQADQPQFKNYTPKDYLDLIKKDK